MQAALREDIGPGDATTRATIPPRLPARARLVARQDLVVCGLAFAATAFRERSRQVRIECLAHDGDRVPGGTPLLRVAGPAHALLTAERVALNFIQRLSGVSTLTARFVDTRKTTPGWRRFEKYAVACGGGRNHRFGLHDLILIKDNHLAALHGAEPSAIVAAVERAHRRFPRLRVEVEADTLEQVREAVNAGADIVLLDNMSLAQLRHAVGLVAGRVQTEASGGVNLRTVAAIARTGVDFISVGALTHSAPAADVALDFETDPATP